RQLKTIAGCEKIYVNEHLTQSNSSLFYYAKQNLPKLTVYTRNGNIYYRNGDKAQRLGDFSEIGALSGALSS
ncbi:unnamed protein product, partial [Didymodactylos carnosus]